MHAHSAQKPKKPDPRQLSMFETEFAANDRAEAPTPPEVVQPQKISKTSVTAPGCVRTQPTPAQVRVVAMHELPIYSNELIEQVDRSMAALPPEKLWFTYNDIRRSFGVSRATVARRMKQGLVPGLRFQDGRMLEDGAVRRLDREQLRWLLLSVRRDRDRGASFKSSSDSKGSVYGRS